MTIYFNVLVCLKYIYSIDHQTHGGAVFVRSVLGFDEVEAINRTTMAVIGGLLLRGGEKTYAI